MITDSGTIPEECLYFNKPCVTIRESTERPEYVEAGSNIIAGLYPDDIINSVKIMTSAKPSWKWDKRLGDGRTSKKVVNILQGKIRNPS